MLLLAGMQLILPLGASGERSRTLLTFGFLILAAYTIGEIAKAIRFPKIVGYLAAGLVFGPSALNIVTAEATHELQPVSSLAIALIALLAGAELRLSDVRESGVAIMKILAAELSLSFVALLGLMLLMREWIPFLVGTGTGQLLAFSILFASIAIVHSPSVTMALLSETGARGPVARTTLGVVLVSDVVVVVLFSAALAAARYLVPPNSADVAAVSIGAIAWEILGAILVGAVLGAGVAIYLRFIRRELFLFAIILAFFGAEIARLTHVETLLTLLTAGFVMENVSRHGEGAALRHAMERSAAPVFVVFFALAGAHMAVAEIMRFWYLIIPIALVRVAAIWLGTGIGYRWARIEPAQGRLVWMGLVSQAGVAIGLATVVGQVYPVRGALIQTLFLAVIAINETVGPILFRHALVRSGEASDAEPTDVMAPGEPRPAGAPAS
jgi:Kef-type K+ transport system membrane component KefB